MDRLPKVVQRLLTTIALGLAFVIMASVFVPADSLARPLAGVPRPAIEPVTLPPSPDLVLGTVESAQYIVEIISTNAGPRYRVFELASGEQLAEDLTVDQVHQYFPSLNIESMDFSAPTQLMYTPTDDSIIPY